MKIITALLLLCLIGSAFGDVTPNPPDPRINFQIALEVQKKVYESEWQRLEQLDKETEEQLKKIGGVTSSGHESYLAAARVWRELADRAFAGVKIEGLPELPDLSKKEPQDLELLKVADELARKNDERIQQLSEKSSRQLLAAGKLRSRLLTELLASGDQRPQEWSEVYFGDIAREIRITPHRALAMLTGKLSQINQQRKTGLRGIILIAQEVGLLAVFIFLIGLVWYLLARLSGMLNRLRLKLVGMSYRSQGAKQAAIWLQRLTPYVTWVLILLVCPLGRMLLAQTVFEELAGILPYIEFYAWYRIIRASLTFVMIRGFDAAGISLDHARRVGLYACARRIGLFLLLAFWFQHSVESAVSRGFVTILMDDVLLLFFSLHVIWVFRDWRESISEALNGIFSPPWNERVLKIYQLGFVGRVLVAPGFVLLALYAVLDELMIFGERFDFFKRLSAQVFRRRLEGLKNEKAPRQEVDQEYITAFEKAWRDSTPSSNTSNAEIEKGIIRDIERWSNDESDEHTLALVAEPGLGKSSVFTKLEGHFGEKYRIVRLSIPPKLLKAEAVNAYFAREIDSCFAATTENSELGESDEQNKKTLILVDEAHHLFLGKVGGFEGLRAFFDLFGRKTENFFWVVSMSPYFWGHVDAVFKRAPFFGRIVHMRPWSEQDVRELILSRHQATGYELSFDQILSATRLDDDDEGASYVESRFFRLLWEESRGNPRVALELWPSCLSSSRGKTLRVGLPAPRPESVFSGLRDETFFVFAALVRHESLTLQELIEVTDLELGVTRHAIKLALDKGFIEKQRDRRFNLVALWQHRIIGILTRKNFLYGA
jgi:hypothetical protein